MEPRTDEAFRQGQYSSGKDPHQLFLSPLLELDIPLVSGVPLDYMHLVLLGVQKRLIRYWKGFFRGIKDGELCKVIVARINSQTDTEGWGVKLGR